MQQSATVVGPTLSTVSYLLCLPLPSLVTSPSARLSPPLFFPLSHFPFLIPPSFPLFYRIFPIPSFPLSSSPLPYFPQFFSPPLPHPVLPLRPSHFLPLPFFYVLLSFLSFRPFSFLFLLATPSPPCHFLISCSISLPFISHSNSLTSLPFSSTPPRVSSICFPERVE